MDRAENEAPHPAFLPPGTLVGPWRVVAGAGRGAYGAVYKAERVGEEHSGPVALKLALRPSDPRFVREVELLRRLSHPSIPHLRDSGDWQHPSGALHPYLAMEWIEGLPLYDWFRREDPSSKRVLRLLAQLARALEALHALGAVHRDVKGDNVLVRLSDERAFLTDFGSGNYPGTSTLTPYDSIPGTPVYRSWEARLFPLRFMRDRVARYRADPADDLFALGMTGYRLLTGDYLEPDEPFQDEAGTWQLPDVAPPAQLVRSPRVSPQLSALILRMLSVHPEQRGPTAQLAEALEQAAGNTVPTNVPPSLARQTPPPLPAPIEQSSAASVLIRKESSSRPPRPWLMVPTAVLALLAWAWWATPGPSLQEPSTWRTEEDGGTTGLGEAASPASAVATPGSSDQQVLAQETVPKPVQGQLQPDARGRCHHKRHVPLNGGCWVSVLLAREDCEELRGQVFKGRCYVPAMPSDRTPPFNPAESP